MSGGFNPGQYGTPGQSIRVYTTSTGLGGSVTVPDAEDVAYGGHEGTDVDGALDARPPTHVSASSDPAVTDDDGDGHVVGCRWINESSGEEFVAVDVSTGAAVWESTTASSGGSGDVATDAIWDAKGDLAAGTGANTAQKLTVGTNDTILMADSGQTTGLKWVGSQTPSTLDYDDTAAEGTADTFARGDHVHGMPSAGGGGGGALTLIDETVLGSDQADITITGLPNTYTDLVISIVARCTASGDFGTLSLRVGDGSIDTGSNYSSARSISGSGGALLGGRIQGDINLATIAGNTATAGAVGAVNIVIHGYANTSFFKVLSGTAYTDGASDHYVQYIGGVWRNASGEIDQVRIYATGVNLKAGSRMTIWGRV